MKHKPTIHPADLTEHLAVSHPANVLGIDMGILAQKVKSEREGKLWKREESAQVFILRKCIYQLN